MLAPPGTTQAPAFSKGQSPSPPFKQPPAAQPQLIQPRGTQPQLIQPPAAQPQLIQPRTIPPPRPPVQTIPPQRPNLQTIPPQRPQVIAPLFQPSAYGSRPMRNSPRSNAPTHQPRATQIPAPQVPAPRAVAPMFSQLQGGASVPFPKPGGPSPPGATDAGAMQKGPMPPSFLQANLMPTAPMPAGAVPMPAGALLAGAVPTGSINSVMPFQAVIKDDEEELYGDDFWFTISISRLPLDKPDEVGKDSTDALRALNEVVGSQDPAFPIIIGVREALLRQGMRLLYAVISFNGEGSVPNNMRGPMVTKACVHPAFGGRINPSKVNTDWCNSKVLLDLFSTASLREAFDLAERKIQAQFVCTLLRVSSLEASYMMADPIRTEWKKVMQVFPEMGWVQKVFRHIHKRCWIEGEAKPVEEEEPEAQNPVRFFVKKCSNLTEWTVTSYFGKWGSVYECQILVDKKTKKPRGQAFVTVMPQAAISGKGISEQGLRQLFRAQPNHNISGTLCEIGEAQDRFDEAEKTRKEQFKKKALEEREQYKAKAALVPPEPPPMTATEWGAKWRKEIQAVLPKHPMPLQHPKLKALVRSMWKECTDHVFTYGDKDAREGLDLLKASKEDDKIKFSYLPVVELLHVVGARLVGTHIDGAFTSGASRCFFKLPPPLATVDVDAIGTFFHESLGATECWKPTSSVGPYKLFVNGLSDTTSLEVMAGHFSQYGSIKDAVIMVDKYTGKKRGFGFIAFERADSLLAALQNRSSHMVDGQLLEVKQAFVDQRIILAEKEKAEQEAKKALDAVRESKDAVDSMPDAVMESKSTKESMPISEGAVAMETDEVAPAIESEAVTGDAAAAAPVAAESNGDLPSAAGLVAHDSNEDEHTDAENMEALPEGSNLLDGAAPVVLSEESGASMEPAAKLSTVEELEKLRAKLGLNISGFPTLGEKRSFDEAFGGDEGKEAED
eukprot:TRINITY_DN919_c0_g1_i1.p1 TRINITY_DN919_c0_g1~~TRINITY_DN919_c0_g1_i1.p1  ORF type:complete len:954 (-),score=193.70 TRINITY_DN919_c0_g1_i1:295-3156(-)